MTIVLTRNDTALARQGKFVTPEDIALTRQGNALTRQGIVFTADAIFVPQDAVFFSQDTVFVAQDTLFVPNNAFVTDTGFAPDASIASQDTAFNPMIALTPFPDFIIGRKVSNVGNSMAAAMEPISSTGICLPMMEAGKGMRAVSRGNDDQSHAPYGEQWHNKAMPPRDL